MRNTVAFLIVCLVQLSPAQGIRFGLFTDSHWADKATSGTRYYRDTPTKMKIALDTFQAHTLPFMVHLGDVIDGYTANDTTLAWKDLDSVSSAMTRFSGRKYIVLGNHDMASLSKPQMLNRMTGIAVKQNYYSFDTAGYHFVVLDGNYNPDSTDFSHNNYTWSNAWIAPAEKRWLINDLSAAAGKVTVVFLHELLDSTITSGECLKNANEIRHIFENAGNVVAVISGHAHTGGYKLFKNIHYVWLKGMVENALPANNFAEARITAANDSLIIKGYVNQTAYSLKLKQVTTTVRRQPRPSVLHRTTRDETFYSIRGQRLPSPAKNSPMLVIQATKTGKDAKTRLPISSSPR
jgi:hypothetical protein